MKWIPTDHLKASQLVSPSDDPVDLIDEQQKGQVLPFPTSRETPSKSTLDSFSRKTEIAEESTVSSAEETTIGKSVEQVDETVIDLNEKTFLLTNSTTNILDDSSTTPSNDFELPRMGLNGNPPLPVSTNSNSKTNKQSTHLSRGQRRLSKSSPISSIQPKEGVIPDTLTFTNSNRVSEHQIIQYTSETSKSEKAVQGANQFKARKSEKPIDWAENKFELLEGVNGAEQGHKAENTNQADLEGTNCAEEMYEESNKEVGMYLVGPDGDEDDDDESEDGGWGKPSAGRVNVGRSRQTEEMDGSGRRRSGLARAGSRSMNRDIPPHIKPQKMLPVRIGGGIKGPTLSPELSKRYCRLCDKIFKTSFACSQHSADVHLGPIAKMGAAWSNIPREDAGGPKKAQCLICERDFSNIYYLRQHQTHAHKWMVACERCNLGFTNPFEAVQHHNNVHKGKYTLPSGIDSNAIPQPFPFPCNRCDAKFATEIELEEHDSDPFAHGPKDPPHWPTLAALKTSSATPSMSTTATPSSGSGAISHGESQKSFNRLITEIFEEAPPLNTSWDDESVDVSLGGESGMKEEEEEKRDENRRIVEAQLEAQVHEIYSGVGEIEASKNPVQSSSPWSRISSFHSSGSGHVDPKIEVVSGAPIAGSGLLNQNSTGVSRSSTSASSSTASVKPREEIVPDESLDLKLSTLSSESCHPNPVPSPAAKLPNGVVPAPSIYTDMRDSLRSRLSPDSGLGPTHKMTPMTHSNEGDIGTGFPAGSGFTPTPHRMAWNIVTSADPKREAMTTSTPSNIGSPGNTNTILLPSVTPFRFPVRLSSGVAATLDAGQLADALKSNPQALAEIFEKLLQGQKEDPSNPTSRSFLNGSSGVDVRSGIGVSPPRGVWARPIIPTSPEIEGAVTKRSLSQVPSSTGQSWGTIVGRGFDREESGKENEIENDKDDEDENVISAPHEEYAIRAREEQTKQMALAFNQTSGSKSTDSLRSKGKSRSDVASSTFVGSRVGRGRRRKNHGESEKKDGDRVRPIFESGWTGLLEQPTPPYAKTLKGREGRGGRGGKRDEDLRNSGFVSVGLSRREIDGSGDYEFGDEEDYSKGSAKYIGMRERERERETDRRRHGSNKNKFNIPSPIRHRQDVGGEGSSRGKTNGYGSAQHDEDDDGEYGFSHGYDHNHALLARGDRHEQVDGGGKINGRRGGRGREESGRRSRDNNLARENHENRSEIRIGRLSGNSNDNRRNHTDNQTPNASNPRSRSKSEPNSSVTQKNGDRRRHGRGKLSKDDPRYALAPMKKVYGKRDTPEQAAKTWAWSKEDELGLAAQNNNSKRAGWGAPLVAAGGGSSGGAGYGNGEWGGKEEDDPYGGW